MPTIPRKNTQISTTRTRRTPPPHNKTAQKKRQACTAGINRSNTAVQAVLEQPFLTGGRTGTVQPKHLPAGRTGLSDQFLGPVAQDQPGPVGQICPTSWLSLRSDSVRPNTGRTRLFEHRSSSRVRPVNASSVDNQSCSMSQSNDPSSDPESRPTERTIVGNGNQSIPNLVGSYPYTPDVQRRRIGDNHPPQADQQYNPAQQDRPDLSDGQGSRGDTRLIPPSPEEQQFD
ncbi:hypothetical protein PCANC_10562 [Puccinia coronata f. sp. avenae]|uniref:Uncharacterized protein n=1 Tax=Puccinia coronata f. sp. avenae TaxID=200324 RepID=A0A2N5VZ64_9BASI|nr:hypothetical protein PCANC_10562 [Puccinia coronata f. sp. avenae]